MSSIIAILLAAAAASARAADPVPDANCTAAVSDLTLELIIGSDCRAVNGTCPSTCGALFQGLIDTCEGKYYSLNSTTRLFNFTEQIGTAAIFLRDASCREYFVDWVLHSGARNASCANATALYTASVISWCLRNASSCASECQAAMQGVFTSCSACENVSSGDGHVMAKRHVSAFRLFQSEQCLADLDTCAFGDGCSFDGVPAPVESFTCPGSLADAACDDGLLEVALGGIADKCQSTDGECPAACTSLFQKVVDSCAGKYYTTPSGVELFKPGLYISGVARFRVPISCQEPLLDLVTSSSSYNLTCPDAGAILAVWAAEWCASPSEPCSESCRGIAEQAFTHCQSDSVIELGNRSVPFVLFLQGVGMSANLSEECQDDLATCTVGQGCDFQAPASASTTIGGSDGSGSTAKGTTTMEGGATTEVAGAGAEEISFAAGGTPLSLASVGLLSMAIGAGL